MIPDHIKDEIRQHAAEESPRESCGLLVIRRGKMYYRRCRNIAERAKEFILDPLDYASAEDFGEVVTVVHSHPFIPARPSQADLVGCESSGLPWIIVNHPTGEMYRFEPSGYMPPLLGRTYQIGVLDCWALIRDYYKQTLNIDVPDVERVEDWWHRGYNLYEDGHADAGFVKVKDLRDHDVVVMKFASPVPNHGAVFEKRGTIIHHQGKRLSSRDVYGGWYRKMTVMILRHKELC